MPRWCCWIEYTFFDEFVDRRRADLHGLLGLILGTLLVFRTNTSYDRWWEGRKLWGQLVNDSRNLAIKVQTCVQADAAEKHAAGPVADRLCLRSQGAPARRRRSWPSFPALKTSTEQPQHVPGVPLGADLRSVRSLAAERPARRL